jgi:hypothetical protein
LIEFANFCAGWLAPEWAEAEQQAGRAES